MFILKILMYIALKIRKFIRKVISLTILGLLFAAQMAFVMLVMGLIYMRELFRHLDPDYASDVACDFLEDCADDLIPELEDLMNIAKN